MAKQRSQASRFKSPSTGEYCTAAQYIAEVLVQRKAEKDNKGSLAYKFWNKTRKKQYSLQIQKVHQLISEFGERAVYDYIINKNKRVYSAAPKPRKSFGNKSLFSRLRSSDGKSKNK